MADPTENPYAPPAAADPQAASDPAGLWMVQEGYLLVRDGARLPPVPLEGGLDEELTPSAHAFQASARIALSALLVAVGTGVFVASVADRALRYQAPLIGFLVFIFLRVFLRRRMAGRAGIVRVYGFAGVATLAARARRNAWRGRMILASLGFLILQLAGLPFPLSAVSEEIPEGFRREAEPYPYKYAWFLLFLGFYFAAVFWMLLDRRLAVVRHRDGWIYLRGVPAASLQKFAESRPSPPPLRLRKLHDFYQQRLPMRNLLAGRRNPWVVLALFLMKLLRAPSLTRRTFSRDEARVLPEAPPSVQGWWAEECRDNELSAWQVLVTTATDSPQGDLLTVASRALSPDRRYACALLLARVSSGRAFAEVRNVEFRSWTRDGRCLITSSLAPIRPLPQDQDYVTRRLDAESLWRAHAQRCAGVELAQVASVEELRERIGRAQEDHAACLRNAGIYGPLVEEELPAPWPVP